MGRRRLSKADYEFRREIADKFQAAMTRLGLNQTQAAEELNVKKQTISQYINEKATPQAEILARACAKWGITIKYRDTEFRSGAFGAKRSKRDAEVVQMDLFREPQVFENTRMIVTVARSKKSTLQFTIRIKEPASVGS